MITPKKNDDSLGRKSTKTGRTAVLKKEQIIQCKFLKEATKKSYFIGTL